MTAHCSTCSCADDDEDDLCVECELPAGHEGPHQIHDVANWPPLRWIRATDFED